MTMLSPGVINNQDAQTAYVEALRIFDRCRFCFPAHFDTQLTIRALEITENIYHEIMESDMTYHPGDYHIGQYVGRITLANFDPNVESTGESIFTQRSYESLAEALYEASCVSINRTRNQLLEVFDMPYPFDSLPREDYVESILRYGYMFIGDRHYLNNDHAGEY